MSSSPASKKIFWVIVLALVARIVLVAVYPPQTWPETFRYLTIAERFVSGNFDGYLGKNVPLYSFLFIACGFNFQLVFIIQLAMGVAISVFVYFIFLRLTRSEWLGFFAALAYALNPGQMLFEAAYIPEVVCTFWLTLLVFLLVELVAGNLPERWWSYSMLGLISVICLLTRPHYQFVPALLLLFVLWRWRAHKRRALLFSLSLIIPVLAGLGPWLMFQHKHTGKASITTHLGITLMYHTLAFIEHAPDQYSEVRQILLDGRESYLRDSGLFYGAVEAVIPEIMDKTGMSYAQVNDTYLSMAVETIKRKPVLYAGSCARAMARFFKPTWYSKNFGIRVVIAKGTLPAKIAAVLYVALQMGLVAFFILFPLLALVSGSYRSKSLLDLRVSFIFALIWIAALIQGVMGLGENNRYRVSVEPLILGLSIWFIAILAARFIKRPGKLYPRNIPLP